jgi:sirohydrochlorin cobaltochelatase
MDSGLILFAHGARDPRWAEPFERLRDKVRARTDGIPVTLAFLEHLPPGLAEAQGVRRIRIVPMFFGRGGHLRDDFPRQFDAVKARLPEVRFEVTLAAGEDEGVLDALAAFATEARSQQ